MGGREQRKGKEKGTGEREEIKGMVRGKEEEKIRRIRKGVESEKEGKDGRKGRKKGWEKGKDGWLEEG